MKKRFLIFLLVPLAISIACNLTRIDETPTPDPNAAALCEAQAVSTLPLYAEPETDSTAVSQLEAGDTITVTAGSDKGWHKVELADGETAWIVGTYNLIGNCDSLPVETLRPTSSCQITNTSGEAVGIFAEPGNTDADSIARFQPDVEMSVFAEDDGSYQVYIDAFESYGWVSGDGMTLSGECDSLPAQAE